jgi:hypothetical protein
MTTTQTLRHVAVALLATAFTLPAFAQVPNAAPNTQRMDKREANQASRIDKGVASGEINKREEARLERGQARVGKMEAKAASDGKVTGKERVAIERAQDRQSARIARQSHDKQHRK